MEWWMILLIVTGGLVALPFVIQGLATLVLQIISTIAGLVYAIYSTARATVRRQR